MATKKKKIRAPFVLRTLFKGAWLTKILVLLLFVGVLALGNWFAHLPSATRARFGAFEPLCESIGLLTANLTDSLGITGQDASIVYERAVAPGNLPFGEPKVVDTSRLPDDYQMIFYKGYWVAWSPSLRVPLWSAYTVKPQKVVDVPDERPAGFKRDPRAKYSSNHADYTGSGYDRGHMAPNYVIATRYGREAQLETFYMSNIVPQKPDLNRHAWRLLEAKVADDLSALGEDIWVITGIVPNTDGALLPKGGIHIPQGFYKILATVRDGRLYALGIYMPQETPKSKHARYCFRSIDEIEAMTGIDFFTEISEARQAALESVEVTRFWY